MNPIAYQKKVAEIYADDRLRHLDLIRAGVPAVALALAYLEHCEPLPASGSVGGRLREIMGGRDRVGQAFAADVPCFRPPRTWHLHGTPCEADMVRREGRCGENPQWSYRHVYVRTGQWYLAGFCTRHKPVGERRKADNRAEMAQLERIPEPIPNRGGILPGLFPDWEWEPIYRHVRRDWVPPMYGVVADLWPRVTELHAVGKPKLAVIQGEAAIEVVEAPPVDPPVLRIVRDDQQANR